MKEQKPTGPRMQNLSPDETGDDGAGQQQSANQPFGEGGAVSQAMRSSAGMQNELQARKSRGRLNRDVQSKLGRTLQAYFDDVVEEGVPDRFKDLLRQFDERNGKDKGSA